MNSLKWTGSNLPMPPQVADCFQRLPERKYLVEETKIFRFRTNRLDAQGNLFWECSWWFPKCIFKQIVGQGARTELSVKVSARSGFDDPRRFNSDFDDLVITSLKLSGFSWAGKAVPQKWSDPFQVQLSGGIEQWFMPGLVKIDLHFKIFGWPE